MLLSIRFEIKAFSIVIVQHAECLVCAAVLLVEQENVAVRTRTRRGSGLEVRCHLLVLGSCRNLASGTGDVCNHPVTPWTVLAVLCRWCIRVDLVQTQSDVRISPACVCVEGIEHYQHQGIVCVFIARDKHDIRDFLGLLGFELVARCYVLTALFVLDLKHGRGREGLVHD